jgi:DNA-binding transcriptional LysR family regulator
MEFGADLRSGALLELLPGFRSIELGIHGVYATRKHMPLKTRHLIDFLVDALATPEWCGEGGLARPVTG